MSIFGVEDRPDLFQGARRAVVQIGRGCEHVGQLWRVEYRRAVGPLTGAHIGELLVGVVRTRVANRALVILGNRRAVLRDRTLVNRLATLLRRRQVAIRQAVAVRTQWQRLDEGNQVTQFLSGVALRAVEILFGSRPALGLEVGVAAVPLEWLGAFDVLEQAVVYDVLAEPVRLQVPLEAVKCSLDVAICAPEVSLKSEPRAEEKLLPPALGSERLGPFERNRAHGLARRGIDYRDRVIQPVRHIKAASVRREHHAFRSAADRDPHGNVVGGCGKVVCH